MNITGFYNNILTYPPYEYQEKVAELLLEGKNVILSIPTGAGKTWASIIPFLYAMENNNSDFPKKMIYSLPLRTIANSIHADVSEVLNKKENFRNLASIHTGEYKNDEHFESDIVFSTIDQTLSNFLCFPLALSKRQANINAGALVGSYLVFDEFHLLEPKLSMATTLGMLKTLKNLCRFCIMTATLSEAYINQLKNAIDAEIVHINNFPEDANKIASLKVPENKKEKKSISVSEQTINAEDIIKKHQKKTIIICNRVEKAQQLYSDLVNKNLTRIDKSNIICLHSRFFDNDRKAKENKLKQLFGKNSDGNAILISTQVIEAGMDISCDTMHIEISPVNSLLQRAGRCGRWEGQYGNIYVYNILDLEEKETIKVKPKTKEEARQIRAINNKYLPYDKDLCVATLNELKKISFLNKDVAQSLVDKVLTKKELEDYTLIKQKEGGFNKHLIKQSWENCEKNMYSQTIRDIQSLEVAIIDYDKEKNRDFYPYKYQSINLYKWTFIKWAKIILENKVYEDDSLLFKVEKNSESQFIDFDTLDNDSYRLKPFTNIDDIKNHYETIFVDKSIFKYSPEIGFEIGEGNQCSPLKPYEKKDRENIEYKKDTFYQHNKAIINCYKQEYRPKLDFTFKQLNKFWGEVIDWDKLIKAMICLHDYGKLNEAWQITMKQLQRLKAKKDNTYSFDENETLAHSDFNQEKDADIEKQSKAKKKPPHAGIGALALIENIEDFTNGEFYEELGNCVATAILKHHGVETEKYPDFNITENNYDEINTLLNEVGINAELLKKARFGSLLDNIVSNDIEKVIYLFLVRILRLCDQKATIDFIKYLK